MGYVGVAPGTITMSLPDGSTIALADWIDDKLYGCVQLVSGQTTPVEAYSSGRSQPIPGGTRVQTRVDTNIPRNGDSGLPMSWAMLVYGWGISFVRACRPGAPATQPVLADTFPDNGTSALSNPVNLATLFQINRVLFFDFQYNGKSFTQGVPLDYPQGNGFDVFSTQADFELAQNGRPSPRDRVALVIPVHMRENLGFKGIFQPEAPPVIQQAPVPIVGANTALTFVDLKLYSYGLIKRSVI